jgi:hypothetical protein
MSQAGLEPDPWQARILASTAPRLMLLCSRQVGKSTTAGALVAQTMVIREPAFCLVLAQNQDKSAEFVQTKVRPLLVRAGVRIVEDNKLSLVLANGSRVIGMPGSEKGVRGFSAVDLLMIDEASRIPDELYFACRPMLAISKGRLVAASTPFGKRGWFFEEWERGTEGKSGLRWHRERITAYECPRYSREFLEEEKATMGERWFNQEYLAIFEDAVGAVFSEEDIRAAVRPDLAPMVRRERKVKP